VADTLIIIDMQVGSFTPETPRYDAEGLVQRLNALAAHVRQSGGVVIFVQHDGPPGDQHAPDAPGWALLPDLVRCDGDLYVRKTTCDSFHDTALEALLRERGASRVILTGCATDFCVDTSVRAAAIRGFETWAPADGHTTADRPHLKAPQIIAHHNYVWAEFIAPRGPVRVTPIADLLSES
jgi:nicotinamidase-related amidase